MTKQQRIWIDLDNTPHVPFFKPIIRELETRGEMVSVTAREAFQVCELADLLGVDYVKIGRHYGRNRFRKVLGLLWRSVQLVPFVLRNRPTIALSHGSRSQILLANLLRIPTVMIMDYEHARTPLLLRPRWEIVPDAIKNEKLQCDSLDRILHYDGIKEDVYAHDFQPDPTLPECLGLDGSLIVVTVRPPADEAHYHSSKSDDLFIAFMNMAHARENVRIILLPRNKRQEGRFRRMWPQWFRGDKVFVPGFAVDGLNLLWHSDLVASGGGTMNREAAALRVPVYSIFRGPVGAVDRKLQIEGRLSLIEDVNELEKKIAFIKRQHVDTHETTKRSPVLEIIQHIDRIGERERTRLRPGSKRKLQTRKKET